MKYLVLGAGKMGRAIAYDLKEFSDFDEITVADKEKENLSSARLFLDNSDINFKTIDLKENKETRNLIKQNDVVISAVPYYYNLELTKIAINSQTHFIDLGGNNKVVENQKNLFEKARKNKVIVIPDSGLAPGLVSIITKDITDVLNKVDFVKIRVGGLPVKPVPPFNYQIVFSVNGLINEYVEDAIILDHGRIIAKKSMTDIESIDFPYPFGKMEAFLTSGGCSTLPYNFRNKIGYLDYKTIRYPSHCRQFKPLLDIGLGSEKPIQLEDKKMIPRDILIKLLLKNIPTKGKDVVLLKVLSSGEKDRKHVNIEYNMIDYYDEEKNISAMMRTTSFPASIIAQMIENKIIRKYGVFCNEEIVKPDIFFKELGKRNIFIKRKIW